MVKFLNVWWIFKAHIQRQQQYKLTSFLRWEKNAKILINVNCAISLYLRNVLALFIQMIIHKVQPQKHCPLSILFLRNDSFFFNQRFA